MSTEPIADPATAADDPRLADAIATLESLARCYATGAALPRPLRDAALRLLGARLHCEYGWWDDDESRWEYETRSARSLDVLAPALRDLGRSVDFRCARWIVATASDEDEALRAGLRAAEGRVAELDRLEKRYHELDRALEAHGRRRDAQRRELDALRDDLTEAACDRRVAAIAAVEAEIAAAQAERGDLETELLAAGRLQF